MATVLIIESEAGWGQKVENTLEFSTDAEAEQYVREYNRKHNPPMEHTPDWYMYAKLENDDSYGMMR